MDFSKRIFVLKLINKKGLKFFKNISNPSDATSIKFDGSIWKIVPGSEGSIIYVESRDPENRQLKFYGVDLSRKKVIWEYIDREERWWLGLEDSFPTSVLIHGYQNPKFPEHKGLIALDAAKGSILWKNPSWVYVNKSGNNLVVTAGQEDHFLVADSKKGDVLQEINSAQLTQFINIEPSKIISGHSIKADQEAYLKIGNFISDRLNLDIVEEVSYLEYKDHLIASFYIVDQENTSPIVEPKQSGDANGCELKQMLWIVDKNGNQKICKTLGKKLKGISSDPFFVFGNMVIFLVEKNELVIYGLE